MRLAPDGLELFYAERLSALVAIPAITGILNGTERAFFQRKSIGIKPALAGLAAANKLAVIIIELYAAHFHSEELALPLWPDSNRTAIAAFVLTLATLFIMNWTSSRVRGSLGSRHLSFFLLPIIHETACGQPFSALSVLWSPLYSHFQKIVPF